MAGFLRLTDVNITCHINRSEPGPDLRPLPVQSLHDLVLNVFEEQKHVQLVLPKNVSYLKLLGEEGGGG